MLPIPLPLGITTDPIKEKGVESERTCDLPLRSREPLLGVYIPESQGVSKNDSGCNGRELSVCVDRFELREAKDNRHKGKPEHGGDCDWVREPAKVERSSYELI